MRVALVMLLALGLAGSCGGDDDGPVDGAPGVVADAPVSAGDAGGGACAGADDCGGEVCCDSGEGGACVPTFEDCAGLVLCGDIDECPDELVCCPQGFCGGCD
jgi:hypothetical protein